MGLKKAFSLLVVLILLSTQSLQAQLVDNSAIERFERELDQVRMQTRNLVNTDVPAEQRLFIDYGASLTLSYAAIDDSDYHTHQFNQYQLIGFARFNMDGAHDFFVRASSTYRDFHPASDSFDNHGDDWEEFSIDRAVYRFDLSRFLSAYNGQSSNTNVIFEGGRQYIHWFNGLVFSDELDGMQLTIEQDKFTFKGLAGTTTRRTIDIDSARPDYDEHTHRDFFAGSLSYRISERHTPFIYGMFQQDHNDTGSYNDGTYTTEFDYESWYVGVGSKGTFNDQLLYNIEWVYQGGRGLSSAFDQNYASTPQTQEDIAAYAMAANLIYQLNDDNYTRIDGEVILASGDGDRLLTSSTYGGNQTGTQDTAFNAFGAMNTGLAFAPEVSNLLMLRMGISTFPLVNHETFKRLQVGTNVYLYNKLNKNAPIEETSEDHTFLGVETDFFANWQVTHDLSVAARYGIFFGGNALSDNAHPRNFFFTSFTLAF